MNRRQPFGRAQGPRQRMHPEFGRKRSPVSPPTNVTHDMDRQRGSDGTAVQILHPIFESLGPASTEQFPEIHSIDLFRPVAGHPQEGVIAEGDLSSTIQSTQPLVDGIEDQLQLKFGCVARASGELTLRHGPTGTLLSSYRHWRGFSLVRESRKLCGRLRTQHSYESRYQLVLT